MANTFINLVGQRFGRLTVIEYAGKTKIGVSMWECLCECGNKKIVSSDRLKRSATRSCGCLRIENAKRTIKINGDSITHGMSRTSVYRSWQNMKKRCYVVKNKDYPNYGGKGVIVCDRWKDSFENFYADMGEKPSIKHSLDKDIKAKELGIPALIYSPDMCCWATQKEQQNNRSNNRIIEYNGLRLNMTQWAAKLGVKRTRISERIRKYGWAIEDALQINFKNGAVII